MPDPLSPVGLFVRALLFGAILAALGAAAFRYLILVPLSRRGEQAFAVAEAAARRAAHIGAFAAAIVVLAALARLALQLADVRDPETGEGPTAHTILSATTWGRAWLAQVAAAAIAILAFARRWWLPALGASLVLAFTPAFSGHAWGSAARPLLAVAADGLHVVGGGMWIGAMVILMASLAVPRSSGASQLAAVMIAAFSPLALGAAATVAVTGGISAWLHLGSLEALGSTRYGRTLLVKLGTVLAVVALGAFNWKRAGPKAMLAGDERPMLRSIRAELIVAFMVLVATAALVVTPPPGEE